MKNIRQKTIIKRLAPLLIMVHLPITALMPMQVEAHFLEHRANTDHALAHSMLSCRLACTAFVFMPSPVTGVLQGLSLSFETQSLSYENCYEKITLSEPSIRGPPCAPPPFPSPSKKEI